MLTRAALICGLLACVFCVVGASAAPPEKKTAAPEKPLATPAPAPEAAANTVPSPGQVEDLSPVVLRIGQVWSAISRVWEFALYTDANARFRVTVKAVCIALLILLGGIYASRRGTLWLSRRVLVRSTLDPTVAATIEKAVYYGLLVFVVLFALYTVQIPLTVFTLFGGALAIGVGFGAQNLINNFISGLILLLERPIKINDVIEVDGQQGRVVTIGARCSQLRLFNGVDVLVPNSVLLEKNVVNLTHSDPTLRFSVKVGVAYGSPVKEVARLLLRAVKEHAKVLRDPEPLVIFTDFGADALQFEAFFWLDLSPTSDARVVASDLRFRIDELFREAGIAMAFPQRDVHVDVSAPIPIRVVPETPPPEAANTRPASG